jgi:hypothetical protein
MLLGNYSVLHKSPAKFSSGQTASGDRANWNKIGMVRSAGDGTLAWSQIAVPLGFTGGSAWVPPRKAGGMALRGFGTGALSANLIPSRAMQAALSGVGDLGAIAALVVGMAIAMSGGGGLSGTIQGRLNATADFVGQGTLTAGLSALANMISALQGQGNLSAVIAAYGNMTIDIVVTGTGLSTANVADAVWGALAAVNNKTGSMGKKLNDAGTASNPWTQIIESGYTAAEILKLLVSHAAGPATGLEGSDPQFKSLDGTKTRIDGTYSAGTRTIDALDVT